MSNDKKTEFKLSRGLLIPILGLASVESFLFIVFLLLIPKDPKNSIFLGFSLQRVLLLAGIFGLTVLFLSSFIYFRRNRRGATLIDHWLLSQEIRIPALLVSYFLFWLGLYAGLTVYKPDFLLIVNNPSSMLRLSPYWGLALLIPFQFTCFWFYEWKSSKWTLPSYLAAGAFIVFFILGLSVYQRYGIAWDEPLQLDIGQTNWEYIINKNPEFLDYPNRYYGPAYEVVLYQLTNNSDTRQMYLNRHLFNFLFFFAGVMAFYWLARRLFASSWMALTASVFLMISPRIFADSFYNSKDIPFLVVFIFTMATLVLFLDSPNWITAMIHGSASALLIAIRVPGVFIPVITFLFLAARWVFQPKPKKILGKEVIAALIYVSSAVSLTILFWPILWHDPWGEFIHALQQMSQYPWIEKITYMGSLVATDRLPWHYIPVWIAISTPILYVAWFGVGVVLMVTGLVRRSVSWFQGETRNSLIILAGFFGPLMSVIALHSVLYDAWRQMFFIYPAFLLAAVQGIRLVLRIVQHRLKPGLLVSMVAIVFAVGLADPIAFMIRNHPFENIYFNRLAGANMGEVKQRFEMDYWGLSFKDGIDYILKSDPGTSIPVFVSDPPGYEYINLLLPEDQRNRLVVVNDIDQARYFVCIYRSHPDEYPYQKKIYSVDVGGASILSVFDLRAETNNKSR